MSGAGIRAGAAVFVIGLLFVWLVRPIGNPCPDVDRLPSGSDGSSAPSFSPPLTRTCTYSTPEGTQARRRYVPVLDLVALLVVAGVVGGAIGVAGPGRSEGRAERERAPGREQPERRATPTAGRDERSRGERDAARRERDIVERERDALERERARREREARRRR